VVGGYLGLKRSPAAYVDAISISSFRAAVSYSTAFSERGVNDGPDVTICFLYDPQEEVIGHGFRHLSPFLPKWVIRPEYVALWFPWIGN
jgi:hypothetical protein